MLPTCIPILARTRKCGRGTHAFRTQADAERAHTHASTSTRTRIVDFVSPSFDTCRMLAIAGACKHVSRDPIAREHLPQLRACQRGQRRGLQDSATARGQCCSVHTLATLATSPAHRCSSAMTAAAAQERSCGYAVLPCSAQRPIPHTVWHAHRRRAPSEEQRLFGVRHEGGGRVASHSPTWRDLEHGLHERVVPRRHQPDHT